MSISSTLYVRIFRTNVVLTAFFLVTCMYVEKAAKTTFEQKIRTYNVDEIDSSTIVNFTLDLYYFVHVMC